MATKVIRAKNGKVWLTREELSPALAFSVLFLGTPGFEDRGDYVIKIRARSQVPIIPGPRAGLEWFHYGSLRDPRHMKILSDGPNPF
jgi:hypothetical protein